jgi:hypothetical protein
MPGLPIAARKSALTGLSSDPRVPSGLSAPSTSLPGLPSGYPVPVRPRYVVLVDDYDLLPMATGSPLGPLLDLLGQGRELGLHLVLARSVAGAARASFEPVFQRLRELGGPGLIMHGDPGEGPLLSGHKAAALPQGRGLLIRRRHPPTLVQVAYRPPPTRTSGAARAPSVEREPVAGGLAVAPAGWPAGPFPGAGR